MNIMIYFNDNKNIEYKKLRIFLNSLYHERA